MVPRGAGIIVLLAVLAGTAAADTVVVPDKIDRGHAASLTYRLDRPAHGKAILDIDWTDSLGRDVSRQRVTVDLGGRTDIPFTLETQRAVAIRNHVSARLTLNGAPRGKAEAEVIIRPAGRDWTDYQIIMWERQRPAQWATLKRLGVTAGIVFGDREGKGESFTGPQIDALLTQDLRWYVENIATDFYAAYHRWQAGKPVNAEFLDVQQRYARQPSDPGVLIRQPSLTDAAAAQRIQDRLVATVRLHERYGPLFYNLADEPGIADLAAHWDFDFAPTTLAAFRAELRRRYGSLTALNDAWGTAFAAWEDVVPRTTAETVGQPDENFAAWAEFKGWMDVLFARTLREGGEAVRRADPKAPVAITGGQVPGWGGWNYATLAGAVDVMETGFDGHAFDMARSLDPPLVLLTTAFGIGGAEEHRVWRRWLAGGRGLILWDTQNAFATPEGALGPRGKDAAPYFATLRAGLGALVIQSQRQIDAVSLLYSPASFRTRWLLDRRAGGDDWSKRTAETEYDDNDWRAATVAYMRELERMGLRPRFLASGQVEAGELIRGETRVLVLPHILALSAREAEEIRRFVDRGGIVVADIVPGEFNENSRRRPQPALADLFGGGSANGARAARGNAVLLPPDPTARSGEAALRLKRLLAQADIAPRFALSTSDGKAPVDPDIYTFRNGNVTLLALHQALPPAAQADNPAAGDLRALDPRRIRLALPGYAYIYDIRDGVALGRAERIELPLDPVAPTMLAISNAALPTPTIQAPSTVKRGETAAVVLSPSTPSPAALHVYHVDVLDPAGGLVPHYSGNLSAPVGRVTMTLPIALNDATGTWEIRVTDRLSGTAVSARIEVVDP